jgi:hypothetical protein
MLSFKLWFFGKETLRQILTLSGWATAKIEFDLKFFVGGLLNGPATKPLLIHEAMESVTSVPNLMAFLEFGTEQGPIFFDRWSGAPLVK